MADVTVKVLTPAESFSLMTLEEAKIMLGISSANTSADAQIQELIDQNSAVISALCNRVFAREEVRESWRELGEPKVATARIFLTHFPVLEDDIQSVQGPYGATLDPASYELEEGSGKLQLFGGYSEPLMVTYTGGYNLPDEAPDALKRAISLLVSASRTEAAQAAITGVRMIAHKDSRIMYHNPAQGAKASSSGSSGSTQAVNALLSKFTKYWV